MEWRDDYKTGENPTISTVVPCAVDPIDELENCELKIVHVRYSGGKGFMPQLESKVNHRLCGNGEVEKSYDEALTQGRAYLTRYVEEQRKIVETW